VLERGIVGWRYQAVKDVGFPFIGRRVVAPPRARA
jgi:hypothetical protein